MYYTVWVGGVEDNNFYFDDIANARLLAQEYASEGYTDVYIETLKEI